MPNFDFTHPNKFTASLGVGLISASIAFPWLLWQSSSVLTLPQKSIEELSPEAQSVIAQRVHIILKLQAHLWWISALLAVIGIALLLVGLLRWDKFQRTQDAAATVKAKKDIEGSQPLSEEEQDKVLQEEVAESLGISHETVITEEDASSSSPSPEATTGGSANHSGSSDDAPGDPHPIARETVYERRMKIAMIESLLAEKLRFAYQESFQVESQRRMNSGGQVDLLLTPMANSNNSQIAFDFKYSTGQPGTMNEYSLLRLAIAARDLKRGTIYTGLPGKPPVANSNAVQIMVVAAPDQSRNTRSMMTNTFERYCDFLRRRREAVNSVLTTPVAQIALEEEELADLSPTALRRQITEVLKDPNR